MEDVVKFKHLLEYFVAHLEYVNKSPNPIGKDVYITPILNDNFKKTGKGYNNDKIQNQIKDWDNYEGNIITITINPSFNNYKARTNYLNWKDTGINVFAGWNSDNKIDSLHIGYCYWWNNPSVYEILMTKTIEELELYTNDKINSAMMEFYEKYINEIKEYNEGKGIYYQKENEYGKQNKAIETMKKYEPYIELLKSNHNIILTGAPGTGKTHLAKQIAQAMGCTDNEIGFVQFHPSYDYTDFVEGLRPMNDDSGNVGFERKDGVFKEFCKRALKNFLDSSKQKNEIKDDEVFEKVYSSLLNDIEDETISTYPTQKGECDVFLSKTNQIIFNTKSESGRKKYVKEDYLKALFNDIKDTDINLLKISREQLDERVAKTTDIKHVDYIQYRWVLHHLVEKYKELKAAISLEQIQTIELKPFVFIIDEINRGEISKIFGELFFAIDPGYRGSEKCRDLRTQYANLQESRNAFDEVLKISNADNYGHFFVPENVYIIGTMNDIDRSVESMDFAFRRRFAFKEVTAEESKTMLDSEDSWKGGKPDGITIQAIKNRMDNLNYAIWHKLKDDKKKEKEEEKSIEGLSSAYHIGASYFLKLANYKNGDGKYDFEKLWKYHLEGLLFEYLRGMQDIEGKIMKLHSAYQNDKPKVESKPTENGNDNSTSNSGQSE